MFFISGTRLQPLSAQAIIKEALQDAGLIPKASKGVWDPTQCLLDHLGMCITSVTGTFSAPPRRLHAVASLAKDLFCSASRSCCCVPWDLLCTFTGTATSLSLALRSASFQLRSVYDVMDCNSHNSMLSCQALTDLSWWASLH
jgi:hypothetical protein